MYRSYTQSARPAIRRPVLKNLPIYTSIFQRSQAIAWAVQKTAETNQATIEKTVEIFSRWMKEEQIVRIVGAGRALIAATIPANRLAHGGAKVSIVGGLVPLPNTALGGAILAASASGKTPFVLQILEAAKKKNSTIERIGIADKKATKFRNLIWGHHTSF
jgi:D-arabinose 5-phosphate isomerase GutQ